jgi:hypothetical protein
LNHPGVIGDIHKDDVVLPRLASAAACPDVLTTFRERIAIDVAREQDSKGLLVGRPKVDPSSQMAA